VKLCAAAQKIIDGRKENFVHSERDAGIRSADRLALARVLNRHISRCPLCSK
jgi:hypothetical protein